MSKLTWLTELIASNFTLPLRARRINLWYKAENFFDLNKLKTSRLDRLLTQCFYVWDILELLEDFIKTEVKGNVADLRRKGDFINTAWGIKDGRAYQGVAYELGDPAKGDLKVYFEGELLEGAALIMPGVILYGDQIEIENGALIESGAMIKEPAIIGSYSEVRQTAYVRGSVMSSQASVIGHSTEAKNVLMMPGAKAGHFAYLGDSILGFDVNLGAGTKLANLKMNSMPHVFASGEESFQVSRRKFGAIIGDESETGCNTVLNPGTILGPKAKVLPNTSLAPGFRAGKSFLKK